MSILMPHLGIGIGYWIGSKFMEHVNLLTKSSSHMGELGLGIGLARSLASMRILVPHLGIGIGYWIRSKFMEHVYLLAKSCSDMGDGGPLNWD